MHFRTKFTLKGYCQLFKYTRKLRLFWFEILTTDLLPRGSLSAHAHGCFLIMTCTLWKYARENLKVACHSPDNRIKTPRVRVHTCTVTETFVRKEKRIYAAICERVSLRVTGPDWGNFLSQTWKYKINC